MAFVRRGPPRIEGEGGEQLMVMKEREREGGKRRDQSGTFLMMKAGPAIGGGRGGQRQRPPVRPAETMCAQKSEFVKKLIKTSEGY